MPKVSVIIPVCNCATYLPNAIDSVLTQTFKDFEIIVVDDGSTDNTEEVVKKYGLQVKYIYQENKGPSAARNRGIKESKGEYIAFLDSDDIWLPQKLELQMNEFLKSPSTGLVTCGRYNICANGVLQECLCDIGYLSRAKALDLILVKNIFRGGSSQVVIRRECLDKVGLFDEELHVAEDWDLWLKICRKYDFRGVDKALVKIRIRENGQSSDGDKNLRNELKFLDKVFSDEHLKRKWLLKRRAYSYRYYSAAIAYREIGRTKEARRYLLKAILTFPFAFTDKKRLIFTFLTIFGFYKKVQSTNIYLKGVG